MMVGKAIYKIHGYVCLHKIYSRNLIAIDPLG